VTFVSASYFVCSHCVYNLFTRAGNRGRWPASVKLVTLPYLALFKICSSSFTGVKLPIELHHQLSVVLNVKDQRRI